MTSRYEQRNLDKCQIETQAVHCGSEPDPLTGAMTAPIYQTATYAMEEVGVTKGYNYSRSINPTVCALEKKLAGLENAKGAMATRSGLGCAQGRKISQYITTSLLFTHPCRRVGHLDTRLVVHLMPTPALLKRL